MAFHGGAPPPPTWLKITTNGWLVAVFALLLGFYFAAL